MTVPGPDSPRYQALLQLLRTAETLWERGRIFFARWELSPSQFNILNLLRDHPDGCTQIELSRLLIVHRSNVTGLVDRLERRGLLRRRDNPGDRRAYRVSLTPRGEALLQEILPGYHAAAERVWEPFSVNRAREISRDLAVLAAQVDRVVADSNVESQP